MNVQRRSAVTVVSTGKDLSNVPVLPEWYCVILERDVKVSFMQHFVFVMTTIKITTSTITLSNENEMR
jgi:hypothetical protein